MYVGDNTTGTVTLDVLGSAEIRQGCGVGDRVAEAGASYLCRGDGKTARAWMSCENRKIARGVNSVREAARRPMSRPRDRSQSGVR